MSSQHEELIKVLRERFPLLSNIGGWFGEDLHWENVPLFFSFFLSAAIKEGPGACCFVMDKSPGTTAIAAVLHTLFLLQNDFPKLLRTYAETALSPGQRVRVKPENFVYEFAGIRNDFPDFFKLRVLDDPSCSISIPMTDVICLEPTEQKIKKGKQKFNFEGCVPNELDSLLDIKTCGNNSIFSNLALLHMAHARFFRLMKSITLAPDDLIRVRPLSEYLSWGTIGPEGNLNSKDPNLVSGEPMIAVTRLTEHLTRAPSSPQRTVFVDGASVLANNLLTYDEITDCQRVVIIASTDETEALDELRKRDTPIWYMSPESILIGESSIRYRSKSSLVGATIHSANSRNQLELDVINCHDSDLQTIADSLENVASQIKVADAVEEVERYLLQLYGVLLELSECCFGVDEAVKFKLLEVQEQINQTEKWISSEILCELKVAVSKLKSLIENSEFGHEKVKQFLKLSDNKFTNWAVVAKSARTANNLAVKLKDVGIHLPIYSVSRIPTDYEFTGIILPSWPNARRFSQLKSKSVTTNIRILAYPFETKWISYYRNRELDRESSNGIDIETISEILGIENFLLEPLFPSVPPPPPSSPPPSIARITDHIKQQDPKRPTTASDEEDSRKAQFVQFSGNCCALLTEWAELPNLNPLINGTSLNNDKLKFVTINELYAGDFVLFRDSGDKEILRILAEDSLGLKKYEQTREIAERWKNSLNLIDHDPNIIKQRLKENGLNRKLQTISGWLSNPYQIGPGNFQDIKKIAITAGDNELLSMISQIKEAITCIRGAHISAGRQLTQLLLNEFGEQMTQIEEQPTRLELVFGVAWVVHVEVVDDKPRDYPVNLVNRLLWNDDIEI